MSERCPWCRADGWVRWEAGLMASRYVRESLEGGRRVVHSGDLLFLPILDRLWETPAAVVTRRYRSWEEWVDREE